MTFTDVSGEFSLAELATWPANAAKGLQTYLRKEAGALGERPLERLKGRRAPRAARQAPLPGIEAAAIRESIDGIAVEREALVARQAEHETLDDALAAQEGLPRSRSGAEFTLEPTAGGSRLLVRPVVRCRRRRTLRLGRAGGAGNRGRL